MKATIQYEAQDLVDAMRLHMRPSPAFRAILYVLLAALGLAVALVLYQAVSGGGWNEGGTFALLIVAYGLIIYRWVLPWKMRRVFRLHKSLHQTASIETTDEAFVAEAANGNMRMPWGDYLKWKANEKLVLLYQSPQLYNMVPRRVCGSKQEWHDLVTFIEAKMGRQRA